MKKKVIRVLLGLAVLAACLILLWPLSFSDVFPDNAEMTVVITDASLDNGAATQESSSHVLSPGSEDFAAVRGILGRYSYHRSFRTIFSDASIGGEGGWLSLFSGENNMTLGGTHEAIVNSHVYRVGYFGDETAANMMSEIRTVLESE